MSFVDSVIYHDFKDLSIFHPIFCFKSWIVTLSQKFQKSDFLGHCSFTQLFHDVEKLMRKPKIFVKVIQRFCYVQHVGLIFKKNKSTRRSQSFNFGEILQCWKNLGMLPSSRFLVCIFLCQTVRQWLPPCVPHGGSHCVTFWQRNIRSKNLDDGNKNIFFCLKVWLLGGWAETSFNQFEQKLSKITLHGNKNCSAPKTGT